MTSIKHIFLFSVIDRIVIYFISESQLISPENAELCAVAVVSPVAADK